MADIEQGGVSPASAGGASPADIVHRKLWIAAEDIANMIGCTVVKGAPRGYGEPDPRDVEIERMRLARQALVTTGYFRDDEVGDDVAPRIIELNLARTAEIEELRSWRDEVLRHGAVLVERIRTALREDERGKTTMAHVEYVGQKLNLLIDEVERLRAANRELNEHLNRMGSPAIMLELADELRTIREALGPIHGDRSMGDTDVEVVANLRAAFTEASKGLNRQSARANEYEVGIEHWQGLAETRGAQVEDFARSIRDLTAERDDYANRLRETDRAYTAVAAERDRLRQELDLALKRNDELRSTQGLMGRALLSVRDTVREVDAELKANAEADRDIAQANERALRRRLNRIAQETSFESALDAEPENGHTVACGAGNEDYSELSCTLTSGHGGEHQDRTQGATWPVEMAVDTKAGA